MNIVPINQYRYPDDAINKTTKKKPTCVLAACQMAIQARTNSVMFQDEFYAMAVKANAIRYDGYIHSYERLFSAYLKRASWITFQKSPPWFFTEERADALRQIKNGNPVLAFLGGHCVLIVDETPTGKFVAYDPGIKTFETPVILQSRVKRYGFYGA